MGLRARLVRSTLVLHQPQDDGEWWHGWCHCDRNGRVNWPEHQADELERIGLTADTLTAADEVRICTDLTDLRDRVWY